MFGKSRENQAAYAIRVTERMSGREYMVNQRFATIEDARRYADAHARLYTHDALTIIPPIRS